MNAYDPLALEPSLREVLKDPIIQLIMKKDGVSSKELIPVLKEAANKLTKKIRYEVA